MMNSEVSCSLTSKFGETVQIVLAFLVLVVLFAEYLIERLYAWRYHRPKRDLIQFWFDTFKISSGAALSHLYNVLVAMLINGGSGDECALYALAFLYEGSGVPFVQLLTYCVVKYAESRAKVSAFWRAIATPGVYNHVEKNVLGKLSPRGRNSKLFLYLCISLLLSGACLATGMLLKWSSLVTYIGSILCFVWLFTFLFCTAAAKYQLFQWLSIKVFEKSIWTLFVAAQASYFRQWSFWMTIEGHPRMEAIFYVCLIPMVMNVFMFFMFSRISRFRLPCIQVKRRSSSDQQRFDLHEAVKVGIVFCAIVNSTIWVGCSIAFRKEQVVVILFVSMVCIPLLMGVVFIALGRYLVEWSYSRIRLKTERKVKVNSKEFSNTNSKSNLISYEETLLVSPMSDDDLLPTC